MSLSPAHQPLVYRALPETRAMRFAGFALLAIVGSLLITIAGQIKVPFYPVPATLQTLAVFIIAAAYGRNLAVATVLAYLAQGALGLPVFTGGAGIAYMAGPTGGFLIGFGVAAYIIGQGADWGFARNPLKLFAVTIIGAGALMLVGFAWLGVLFGAGKAWAIVQPFLLPELTKVVLASALLPAIGGFFTKR